MRGWYFKVSSDLIGTNLTNALNMQNVCVKYLYENRYTGW